MTVFDTTYSPLR